MKEPHWDWTDEENIHAYEQGWAIFQIDQDVYALMALDDPEMFCEDNQCESKQQFKGEGRDYQAAAFVQHAANEGDLVCRKAIEFLIHCESEDINEFQLKKTW
jgi:hypothetical protein